MVAGRKIGQLNRPTEQSDVQSIFNKQFLKFPTEKLQEDVPVPVVEEIGDPKKSNIVDKVDKELQEAADLEERTGERQVDPATRQIKKAGGKFDAATQAFNESYEDNEAAVNENLEIDAATAPLFADDPDLLNLDRLDPDDPRSREERLRDSVQELQEKRLEEAKKAQLDDKMIGTIQRKLSSSGNVLPYGNLVSQGGILNEQLNQTFSNIMNEEGVSDVKNIGPQLRETLVNAGLVATDGRTLNSKVGMALALSALELIQDMKNKEDKKETERTDPLTGKRVERFDTVGDVISPEDIRNRLAESVLDKIVVNPNQRGTVSTGYGGFGATLTPEIKSALDTLFYNSLNESGAFQTIKKTDGESFTVVAPEYMYYYDQTRSILDDIFPEKRVNVSYTPTISGESLYSLQRLLGRRTAGKSQKNKADKNTATEEEIKTALGSMPLTVMQDRFTFTQKLILGMVRENPESRRIELIGQTGREAGFYLTGPFANTVGLGEKRWKKAYKHALKTMQPADATDQANLIMRQTATSLLTTIKDGADNTNRVFYNKIMHATSVGRYFIRNTVLNGQNNKVVRNFVGSAIDIKFNMRDGQPKSQEFTNWKYIIAKNLLPQQGVATDRMGWKAVLEAANQQIDNVNSEYYNLWVQRGRELSELTNGLKTNLDGSQIPFNLKDIEALDWVSELTDAGEWGYTFQSYIDMYKYDIARKTGGNFTAKAQTQHDGKQNGIAIMAMQSGKERIMRLVGALFDGEDDVISAGDVRDSFMKELNSAAGITKDSKQLESGVFAGDKDKLAFFNNVITNIMEAPNSRDLIKMLSKVPLMEVSYGKSNRFHHETAEAFIDEAVNSESGIKIINLEDWQGSQNYSQDDLINDLNLLIGKTLANVLDLKHQNILKTVGINWAMLGVTPEMKGPLGNSIYMGSFDYEPIVTKDPDTGQAIIKEVTYKVGDETVTQQLTQPVASGSKQTGKRKLVKTKDETTGNIAWVLQDKSRYGQEVANQLPVLTVQQIDAAIMAKTIQQVSRKRKEKGIKNPLFMQPIHDAIVTDASSVDEYHREINSQFFKVNNNYSIAESVKKGYNNHFNAVTQRLKNQGKGKMMGLNYQSPHRALHDFLVKTEESLKEENLMTAIKIGQDKDYPTESQAIDFEGGGPSTQSYNVTKLAPKNRRLLLQLANRVGWKSDGTGLISAPDIATLIEEVYRMQNVEGMLNNWVNQTRADKKEAYKRIPKETFTRNGEEVTEARIYQYN